MGDGDRSLDDQPARVERVRVGVVDGTRLPGSLIDLVTLLGQFGLEGFDLRVIHRTEFLSAFRQGR